MILYTHTQNKEMDAQKMSQCVDCARTQQGALHTVKIAENFHVGTPSGEDIIVHQNCNRRMQIVPSAGGRSSIPSSLVTAIILLFFLILLLLSSSVAMIIEVSRWLFKIRTNRLETEHSTTVSGRGHYARHRAETRPTKS